MPDLILASASPRRKALLEQIGVSCLSVPVDLDESVLPGELPEAYVRRLALAKAQAGWRKQGQQGTALGSDTSVVIDSEILGKPADGAEAVAMLQRLSGKTHQVMTAVALVSARQTDSCVVTTDVSFKTLTLEECHRYWNTGEPHDKAGGYGIQGLGAVFVTSIRGSYSGVVGLPLAETAELLYKHGINVWQQTAVK